MTPSSYFQDLVGQMSNLMVDIATGKRSLQKGDADQEYQRLHSRLVAAAPLIKGLPKWFHGTSTGWSFWQLVQRERPTYEDRRRFIQAEFTGPVSAAMGSHSELTLEAALANRDIILEGQIGDGGFGRVFKGYHTTLDVSRAVKVFDPRFYDGGEEPLRRFAREGGLLSRLSHPNIVRFFDAGIAGKTPFIVTELLDGQDLQSELNGICGWMSPDDVVSVCDQVLRGLEHAHGLGVIHRDIKPRNIMWHNGKATILDFGAGNALTLLLTTRLTTNAIGTPGYIAHELLENPQLLDPRIDLYAVGVLAHQLLTNHMLPPIRVEHYMDAASVPKALQQWVIGAIQPIELRYPDATTMRSELHRAVAAA